MRESLTAIVGRNYPTTPAVLFNGSLLMKTPTGYAATAMLNLSKHIASGII
jgi:hypothetical protein